MKNQELMNALQSIGQKISKAKEGLGLHKSEALDNTRDAESELNALCQRIALEEGIYVPPTGGSDVKPGHGLGIKLSINIDRLFGGEG